MFEIFRNILPNSTRAVFAQEDRQQVGKMLHICNIIKYHKLNIEKRQQIGNRKLAAYLLFIRKIFSTSVDFISTVFQELLQLGRMLLGTVGGELLAIGLFTIDRIIYHFTHSSLYTDLSIK